MEDFALGVIVGGLITAAILTARTAPRFWRVTDPIIGTIEPRQRRDTFDTVRLIPRRPNLFARRPELFDVEALDHPPPRRSQAA